jgi:hypothetical protein
VIRLFDLRISAELVSWQCGRVGVHGIIGVDTTLAAFKRLSPGFDAGLNKKSKNIFNCLFFDSFNFCQFSNNHLRLE